MLKVITQNSQRLSPAEKNMNMPLISQVKDKQSYMLSPSWAPCLYYQDCSGHLVWCDKIQCLDDISKDKNKKRGNTCVT
jgi:hypothetical protein